jgi:hypothetical protein
MQPIRYAFLRVNGYSYIAPTPADVVALISWFYCPAKAA